MINTEFIEDAHDHAPDLVAAAPASSNRLDEHVQRLFVVTSIECLESLPQIRHPALFEPDPGGEAIGREASMNLSQDLERLVVLPAGVEHRGQLDASIDMPRLSLQSCAERHLIPLLSEQVCLGREKRIEKALHRGCRLRTDELGDDFAFMKSFDRGNALNPVRPGDGRICVDIELYKLKSARALFGLPLKDGPELATRRTPVGPEVDHHG